jgi:carboxylesterase
LQPLLEQELELAHTDGVKHPGNLPYLLVPEQPNGEGVLLVHGFTASPQELRCLGDRLYRLGFTVFGVRLPGHGTTPHDLAHRHAEEWLAAVERGYQLLAERNLQVIGIGLSTGTLTLLNVSLTRPFAKLVLLSPFLKLRHWLAPWADLLSYLIPFHHREIDEDEHPFYYQHRPMRGVAQIFRLIRQIQHQLPLISTPTLVLAAAGDMTIAPGTSRELFNLIGSREKHYFCYGTEAPHVLTTHKNPCQQDVFDKIQEFLGHPVTAEN